MRDGSCAACWEGNSSQQEIHPVGFGCLLLPRSHGSSGEVRSDEAHGTRHTDMVCRASLRRQNRASPGSTNTGNHHPLARTGSSKSRLVNHPRPHWVTAAAFWLSNIPDIEAPPTKKHCPKKIPTKFLGKSDRISIFAFEVICHDSDATPSLHARFRRTNAFGGSGAVVFSPFPPPFLLPPLFSALPSDHRLFQRPSPKRKLLAVRCTNDT